MTRKVNATTGRDGAVRTRRGARHLVGWVACALVALLAMAAATIAYQHGAGLFAAYGSVLVPGVLTLVVVPSAARHAYRWLVVLAIGYVVDQGFASLFLLVALTWLLHVSWVSDRPAGERLRLPHMNLSSTTRKGGDRG